MALFKYGIGQNIGLFNCVICQNIVLFKYET